MSNSSYRNGIRNGWLDHENGENSLIARNSPDWDYRTGYRYGQLWHSQGLSLEHALVRGRDDEGRA